MVRVLKLGKTVVKTSSPIHPDYCEVCGCPKDICCKSVGAKEVLDFILLKQPTDLVVACICGDVKLMIDKKELEKFVVELGKGD
jgi:hypothetical protein